MQLAAALNQTGGVNAITHVSFYNTDAVGRVFSPYDCSNQTSTDGGNNTKYCLQSRYYSCATLVHCPLAEVGGTVAQCAVADKIAQAKAHMTAGLRAHLDARADPAAPITPADIQTVLRSLQGGAFGTA